MVKRRFLAVSVGIVAIVAVVVLTASAATFHVSPQGTNTPPYSTIETAAPHPWDAIAATSGAGDTVLIHAGSFEIDTAISVPAGVDVLGVEQDSVDLVWCCHQNFSPRHMLDLSGFHTISGITFRNRLTAISELVSALSTGVVAQGKIQIHDCRFIETRILGSAEDTLEVYNCYFQVGGGDGVNSGGPGGAIYVHDNYFWAGIGHQQAECIVALSTDMVVSNNIFDLSDTDFRGVAIQTSFGYAPLYVRNNLMLGGDAAISWYVHDGTIENNTIIRTDPSFGAAIYVVIDGSRVVNIRNNLIVNSPVPVFTADSPSGAKGTIIYEYNRLWPVDSVLFRKDIFGDNLNISAADNANAYPMFEDDSLYHLQSGSPLIDRGDPNILDADGSRSDIGWTGGPGGESYSYEDLAPLPPDTVAAREMSGAIELSWARRPEADLSVYRVYRDGPSGSSTASSAWLTDVPKADSSYADSSLELGLTYLYTVTAVDATGHESDMSMEVAHLYTTVGQDDVGTLVPRAPYISRVYPNPFNDATVIEFAVPLSAGSLRIDVFNVLGQRVNRIELGHREAGVHSVEWSASVPSGVYFARLTSRDVALGRTVKLVVLR